MAFGEAGADRMLAAWPRADRAAAADDMDFDCFGADLRPPLELAPSVG